MSVYNTLDFEGTDMATYASGAGLVVTGTPTLVTSPFYETAKAMSCNDAGYVNTYVSFTSNKALIAATGFIQIQTAPPDGPRMIAGSYDGNGVDAFFRLNTARTITIRVNSTDRITTTTAIPLNTWTQIWFKMFANDAASVYEFRIGSELISWTGTITASNQQSTYLGLDNNAGAAVVFFDYFIFDDASYPLPYVPKATMIKDNVIRPRRYAPGIAR
jgi:hypothetical protein